MATSLAQDFSVLRSGGARGGLRVLRALREDGEGLDRSALYIAGEVFASESKQRLNSAMEFETSWFDFALKVRAMGMTLTRAVARRTVSPTDLPTHAEVPAVPVALLPDLPANVEHNRMWLLVSEAAHRAWDFFRSADRLLVLKDRLEVCQVAMDTLQEAISDQLKTQVGVWADLRDSLRPLEQKLAAWT